MNQKVQLCLCIPICVSVYIWNIISLSHKCCAVLYLGCKFSDYNVIDTGHRLLNAPATGAAPTWTSWLSRTDMQGAAALSLTGKRKTDEMASLRRKTQGQAPKGCSQRGDTTVHILPAQEM